VKDTEPKETTLYYFHWDQTYEDLKSGTTSEQSEIEEREFPSCGKNYPMYPCLTSMIERGIKWYHSAVLGEGMCSYAISELQERILLQMATMLADSAGMEPSNVMKTLRNEGSMHFSIEETHEACHHQLHVASSSCFEEAKATRARKPRRPHLFLNYTLYIPLSQEGMVLRVGVLDDRSGMYQNVVPVYVPFGCAILLRADVIRAGSYGSKGNMRFIAHINPNNEESCGDQKWWPEFQDMVNDGNVQGFIAARDIFTVAYSPSDLNDSIPGLGSLGIGKKKLVDCAVSGHMRTLMRQHEGNAGLKPCNSKYAQKAAEYKEFYEHNKEWTAVNAKSNYILKGHKIGREVTRLCGRWET
jgi:hypothetical protein